MWIEAGDLEYAALSTEYPENCAEMYVLRNERRKGLIGKVYYLKKEGLTQVELTYLAWKKKSNVYYIWDYWKYNSTNSCPHEIKRYRRQYIFQGNIKKKPITSIDCKNNCRYKEVGYN